MSFVLLQTPSKFDPLQYGARKIWSPYPERDCNSTSSSTGVYMQSQPATARLTDMPVEIIQHIYKSSSDITSVLSLASSCRQFHNAFIGSQKLVVISAVLEKQIGPLHDIKQLVTHNNSQPAYIDRQPSMSIALAKGMLHVGRIAKKWENLYPFMKWRITTENRRHLRPHERYRFRRALYRIWLYARAYHSIEYTSHHPGPPPIAWHVDPRIAFFRRFGFEDMKEIAEVYGLLHELVYNDICPSDGMIQRRYADAHSTKEILYFGSYETYPILDRRRGPIGDNRILGKVSQVFAPDRKVMESWGSYTVQLQIVEDVMKLDPEGLLHLWENLHCMRDRLAFLEGDPSFHNNPSTLPDSLFAIEEERDVHFEYRKYDEEGGVLDYLDRKREAERDLTNDWYEIDEEELNEY